MFWSAVMSICCIPGDIISVPLDATTGAQLIGKKVDLGVSDPKVANSLGIASDAWWVGINAGFAPVDGGQFEADGCFGKKLHNPRKKNGPIKNPKNRNG